MGSMNEARTSRRYAQRICAVLLALAIALWSMALPLGSITQAYAADEYTITINNATAGTYSAYQILTGTYTSSGALGGDAAVNSSIQSALLAALTATESATGEYTVSISTDSDGNQTITFYDYDNLDSDGKASSTTVDYTDYALAYAVMCQIEQIGDDDLEKTFAANLANAIASASITADATTTLDETGTATLTVDETGYYLVVQSGATTGDNSSAILVNVTSSGATATSKNSTDTPTADKEVVESGGASIVYNEDGTASISYTITGTVAENIADYSTYYYSVVDTLPDGVTISDTTSSISNLSITIATSGTATDVTSSFTQSVTTEDDTSTVSWTCTDILGLTDSDGNAVAVTAATTVKVSYTLVICADELDAITDAANSDTGQFVNTANIVFSNNPYATGTGTSNTGTSTDDEASVQLYNLVVYKVDSDGTALTGASFTLTGDNGYSVELTVNSDGNTFTFTGLEAGVTYTLSETSVPDGYKSIQDVTFTVGENEMSTYDDDGNVLTTTVYPTVTEGSDLSECAEFGASATDSNTITATITNLPGNTLPTTGLSGRTLALLAGLLLIVVCAGLLLTRRRKAPAQQ